VQAACWMELSQMASSVQTCLWAGHRMCAGCTTCYVDVHIQSDRGLMARMVQTVCTIRRPCVGYVLEEEGMRRPLR
jgi:hypothetical protein